MKLTKYLALFFLFTVVGFVPFIARAQTAFISCAPQFGELDCYLKKRTVFQGNEQKFTRSDIKEITQFTRTLTGTQFRKSSEDHWTIIFKDETELPITYHGINLPFGSMKYSTLRDLLINRNSSVESELKMISYGMFPWFVGLTLGAIGWVFLLVAFARPVTNVDEETLAQNRRSNFRMLGIVNLVSISIWGIFFLSLSKFLLNT